MIKRLIELFRKEEYVITPMKTITVYPDQDWTNIADYQQMIRVRLDNSDLDFSDFQTGNRGYAKKAIPMPNNHADYYSWNN